MKRILKPGPGRPKGCGNKLPQDVKEMILYALSALGGYAYLVDVGKKYPQHFLRLVAMLVPRQVEHSGVITGVSVTINTNMAIPRGADDINLLTE
jgi:hypothetical protein